MQKLLQPLAANLADSHRGDPTYWNSMGSETIISPTSFIAWIIHGQGFDLNIYSVRLFRNVQEVHLIILAVLETSSKPRVIYQGAGTRHRRVNIRASAETGLKKKNPVVSIICAQ